MEKGGRLKERQPEKGKERKIDISLSIIKIEKLIETGLRGVYCLV